MDPMTILSLIEAATTVIGQAQKLYSDAKATMSETDQAKIEAALKAIQAQGDADFSRVEGEIAAAT